MKKALSLMEVLISVVLITFVIGTLFEIKSQNLFYLDRFKQTSFYNSVIAVFAQSASEKDIEKRNKNLYFKDVVDISDDEIRRKFKNIKVKVKDDLYQKKVQKLEEGVITYDVYSSSYDIDKKSKKVVYSIKNLNLSIGK